MSSPNAWGDPPWPLREKSRQSYFFVINSNLHNASDGPPGARQPEKIRTNWEAAFSRGAGGIASKIKFKFIWGTTGSPCFSKQGYRGLLAKRLGKWWNGRDAKNFNRRIGLLRFAEQVFRSNPSLFFLENGSRTIPRDERCARV